jgi:DNA-binding CsgD family transcriptional regulator
LAFGLTPRERQILEMVVAGHANKEIARACSVTEQTIKHHLTRVFDKTGASTRVELVMIASKSGLFDSPGPSPVDTAPPALTMSPFEGASAPLLQ